MARVYPLKIAHAATRAGITVHQARLDVAAGLVKPCATTTGGHHLYDRAGIARMRLIGTAMRAGLPFLEVRRLYQALDEERPAEAEAARTLLQAALNERRSILQRARRLLTHACRIPHATTEAFR